MGRFFSGLLPFGALGSDAIVDLRQVKALPKAPFLVSGCEGECCGILKSRIAQTAFELFSEPVSGAKPVGGREINTEKDAFAFGWCG